jgi:hypothetical protein
LGTCPKDKISRKIALDTCPKDKINRKNALGTCPKDKISRKNALGKQPAGVFTGNTGKKLIPNIYFKTVYYG